MRASEFVTEEAKAAKYNGLLMKYAFNDNALIIKAFTKEGPVAFVKFVKENKELYPQNLWVNDEHRSRGIAKSMYDYLKSQGFVINRSHDQTKAGAGFWDKHRGEDTYVWEEVLDELFKPGKKNWEWGFRGSEEVEAKFEVGGVPYKFYASTDPVFFPGTWEVEFSSRSAEEPTSPRGAKFGLTGTGNSAEVMSIVADIMREFLQMYQGNVSKLLFTADEKSRQSLYARMTKRLLPNWELTQNGKQFVLSNPELTEEIIDEMPLPADWDPSQMRQGATTFKSRLAYALERAKKLGTGSSRVATIIEYQGRPTVLKIAKNQKGLAQNSVEADILSDGYASQLGILIPLIDYDEQNREPSWIHTEMATKASDKQLSKMMGVDNLNDLVILANTIAGKSRYFTYDGLVARMRREGRTDDEIETATEYANILADLANSFDVELGDFTRAANWGIYKGKPVIVDVGFNSNVLNQYYKR